MGRLGLAFKILLNGETARRAIAALSENAQPKVEQKAPPAPVPPARSDAVTLLSALQRDARFVDFIQENIDGYNDAQVGAAVRDIHRGCQTVLKRMFDPQPIVAQDENTDVEIRDPSAARWRLTGSVEQAAGGSVSGRLTHPGWQVGQCRIPAWSGSTDDASVIAPAEVQVG